MSQASRRVLSLSRTGNGPHTTVLLHGFLGSGRNLSTLARRWSAADPSLTLLVPDLTGHGTSPALPPDATLADVASDLLTTLEEEVGTAPVDVVGHSLGGRVALTAADLAPERIRHITLLDIAAGPIGKAGGESDRILARVVAAPDRPASREEAREFLLEGNLKPGIVEWVLTNLVAADEGYAWRIDRKALESFRRAMSDADLWPVVERFGDRVRCIRGGASPYVRDEDVERFRSAGVRVDTIEGAGHFVHVDKPKELLELLTQ